MGGIQADICGIHHCPASKCFHIHHPEAHRRRGWPVWTVQVNDIVGGWIVTTYPFPSSEHDLRIEGNSLKCGYIIAECMTKADALAIAHLLNRVRYTPNMSDAEAGRWRWVKVGYLQGSLRFV